MNFDGTKQAATGSHRKEDEMGFYVLVAGPLNPRKNLNLLPQALLIPPFILHATTTAALAFFLHCGSLFFTNAASTSRSVFHSNEPMTSKMSSPCSSSPESLETHLLSVTTHEQQETYCTKELVSMGSLIVN